jgi:hypothetical protein
LIITREEIDTILNRLEDTLQELHATVSTPGTPASSDATNMPETAASGSAVA